MMKEITPIEVKELLENGSNLNLIDVREADEVATGIIPGAIHIPLGEIPERTEELDQSKPYIMVCKAGGRSARAVQYLEAQGYDVTNMTGGMMEWAGDTE